MLCLGHKVCRKIFRFCRLVRNYQNFAWPRYHVNVYLAVQKFLSCCYKNIYGTHNLVHLWNGLRTVSKSRHSLRASCKKYSVNAAYRSCNKYILVGRTVFQRRCHHYYFLYSSYFCRNRIHQYRRWISCRSSGDIKSNPLQTSYSLTENNTVVVRINKALLLLPVVECRNIFHCVKQRIYKILVRFLKSIVNNVQRHLIIFWQLSVKFFGILLNSLVAVLFYIFDYFGNYLRNLFVCFAVALFHFFKELYFTFPVGNDLFYHLSERPFTNFLQLV